MNFISTRGQGGKLPASKAIIQGIADDGGLFVPEYFPNLKDQFAYFTNLEYEDLAFEIIKRYFDDIEEVELKEAIDAAYKNRYEVNVNRGFLELYHGPTSAFKDAALLFLPQIMKKAKKKCSIKEEIVILTATSGDTGKAALEGFSNVDGFKCVVYYPKNGVSAIQEKQMVTQEGSNVKVVGIKGNFDDAQRGVKEIFADKEIKDKLKKNGFLLSSANSINIGRLIPQTVYYFYAYFQLVREKKINLGEKINIAVPTGNFGNILAAYYSKKMGLPIDKLICASNENNVLTDFFNTGIYDKRRELYLTESPSMDILVSSNLERILFEAYGRNGNEIKKLMDQLNANGIYNVTEQCRDFLKDFYGEYAPADEVHADIKRVYNEERYLMDTHTSVAHAALKKYKKSKNDHKQCIVVSTASPYKFPRSICKALELNIDGLDDFQVLELLYKTTKVPVPKNLVHLDKKKVLHDTVCENEQMAAELFNFLKGADK